MAMKDNIDRIKVWSNKEPILTIRRVLWIITAGWWLAAAQVMAALGFALSIIFIPFVPEALKLAWFAIDPITKEAVLDRTKAKKPLTLAANIVWAILVGWALFLGYLMACILQALTIVGIGTALNFAKLVPVALMPFGHVIRPKIMPQSIVELRSQQMNRTQEGNV